MVIVEKGGRKLSEHPRTKTGGPGLFIEHAILRQESVEVGLFVKKIVNRDFIIRNLIHYHSRPMIYHCQRCMLEH